MTLSAGAKLGPYEVLSFIRAGGMGEVYRGRDPRLNREVAIKVLPADRLADPDRRRRFVQEAQAASALNHPHIVTIHEIESADGNDFIVMEYVRGKSLDDLIPRHGMRLSEVLRIAIPVADALAAAHARGIVHRDLKPANVMAGDEGAVKVLDFGLAKLVDSEVMSDGETVTVAPNVGLSAPGTVAGSAAYMSPEQATGGKVDGRSDIFSFGAMLYEMVTGQRAFAGTSSAETLAAVLRAQPKPPGANVPGLPSDLEKVIVRCLRKDPDRRFQHIDDVKIALQEIKEESESGVLSTATAPRRFYARRAAAVAGVVIIIAAFGVWLWLRRPTGPVDGPVRVKSLTTLPGHEDSPTFSPDGEQVAFAAWESGPKVHTDVYVTIVGSSDVRRLTSDAANHYAPSWSPDGGQIAFLTRPVGSSTSSLHVMSALGGSDRRLSTMPVAGLLSWSPDGRHLAVGRVSSGASTDGAGIVLVPTQSGELRSLTHAIAPGLHLDPAFSPDGHRLAYASCQHFLQLCHVEVLDLDAEFSTTGGAHRLTEKPVGVVTGLAWTPDGASLIVGTMPVSNVFYLWRLSAAGTGPPERIEVAGLGATAPATAPSRNRLAFSRQQLDTDIYMVTAGRSGSPEPLLASSFGDDQPEISPDGRRVAFCSARSGEAVEVWVAESDGSAAHQLTQGMGRWQCSPHWSPDGRIAFDSLAPDGQWHIWMMDADGGTPRQLTTGPGSQQLPTWSHDGQWIYFLWKQEASHDIWRTRVSGGRPERLTRGANEGVGLESADGKDLLYQTAQGEGPLLALPLAGGPSRTVVDCIAPGGAFFSGSHGLYYVACGGGADPAVHVRYPDGREELFATLDKPWGVYFGLAVSPDGNKVLYNKVVSDGSDLMMIENFK